LVFGAEKDSYTNLRQLTHVRLPLAQVHEMGFARHALAEIAAPSFTGRRASPAPVPRYPLTCEASIGARLDQLPLSRLHVAILAICAGGFAFDLLELALGGALSAVFSAPPHRINASRLSQLIAAVYIGAIIGAPLLGWLADRFGRKKLLMATLLWLAATSTAMALRESIAWLTAIRLLAGLSIGAFPPLMFTYLTDVLPPRRRGMLILVLCAVSTAVIPLGLLFLRWLTNIQPLGLEAWRWLFAMIGLGAAVAGMMLRLIPESPRWLLGIGRTVAAEAAYRTFESSSVIERVTPAVAPTPWPDKGRAIVDTDRGVGWRPALFGRYRSQLILAATVYFLSPWATVAFPVLSGPTLIAKGVPLGDTFGYLALATFGQLTGSVVASLLIDRIERRTAIVLCAFLMALSALVFAHETSPAFAIGSYVAFGIFSGMFVPALSVYVTELFPTRIRSSATSSTWVFNRIGSTLAILVLVPVLRQRGALPAFDIMAVTLLAGIVILTLFGPAGLARRSVD
jgi:MFS transporter, putative metabolite:H+ symporter